MPWHVHQFGFDITGGPLTIYSESHLEYTVTPNSVTDNGNEESIDI